MQRQTGHWNRVQSGVAVHRVAEHGVAEIRQVYAHLVGAAGGQRGRHQGGATELLDRLERRLRRAHSEPGAERSEPGARPRATDAAVDGGRLAEVSGGECEVAAFHQVSLELGVEVPGGVVVEREHHYARGLAVEAVDDQHATGRAGRPLDGGLHPSHHRIGLVGGRGVNHDPGRFLDHDHVLVEMKDADRSDLRHPPAFREVGVVRDGVAGANQCPRFGHHGARDQHVADLDLAAGP
ncbi:MAG: hypothetical protein KA072_07425 [Thermoanaerobaculaceae bacterium]|nr:hypothetical protein [Thermoanaerobaculaceae bacterium]MDI9622188.1 hypothetical protein [Acidobacteriota bacterium]NLH12619.1 hypothetical protein [Holophagae bacterium]HPW54911.1 hypothetical protein [Thermoanaerobaculaceae bacterium]